MHTAVPPTAMTSPRAATPIVIHTNNMEWPAAGWLAAVVRSVLPSPNVEKDNKLLFNRKLYLGTSYIIRIIFPDIPIICDSG